MLRANRKEPYNMHISTQVVVRMWYDVVILHGVELASSCGCLGLRWMMHLNRGASINCLAYHFKPCLQNCLDAIKLVRKLPPEAFGGGTVVFCALLIISLVLFQPFV